MIYIIFAFFALVSFLVVLNGFLTGAKKTQIDVFLSLLLLCLLFTSFFVYGWKAGLAGIGIALLSAIITRPLAARVASKLFALSSAESGHFPGLPPKALQLISQELGRPFDPNQIMERMGSRRQAEEALIDYCGTVESIRKVMDEYNISKDDLHQFYFKLINVGAGQWRTGHWVAASALAYPETLRYLIQVRGEKRRLEETAWNLLMYFESGTPLPPLEN
jgi:hypothetical protein